jgi:hypothetical protein
MKAADNKKLSFSFLRTLNQKMIFNITRYYFKSLKEICLERNKVHLYHAILTIVARMHEAETASFKRNLTRTEHLRKNGLPFVILGITAWLSIDQKKDRWRHLLWTYRVGSFLGIVDDLVDYDNDFKENQINQFLMDNADLNHLSEQIIRQYQFIEGSIKSNRDSQGTVQKNLLAVCVLSWLGGYSE